MNTMMNTFVPWSWVDAVNLALDLWAIAPTGDFDALVNQLWDELRADNESHLVKV